MNNGSHEFLDLIIRTNFLPSRSGKIRRQWHIDNDIYYIPKCYVCGVNDARWWSKRKGGKYITCSESCRRKAVQTTFNKKYGGNPMMNEIVQQRKKATQLAKYGVEHSSHNNEINTRAKNARKQDYVNLVAKAIGDCYHLIEYDDVTSPRWHKKHKILHTECGHEFTIKFGTLKTRLRRNQILCTSCNNTNKLESSGENEMRDFIASAGYEIITHYQISYYSIDVFIPALNLGFEYDGDIYHANPNRFKSSDMVWKVKLTAQQIWDKDKRKNEFINSKGVRLLRFWEHDWINRRIWVQQQIMDEINITHQAQV